MLSRTNGGCYIKPLCSHAYFFSRNRRPYRGVNLPGFLGETRKMMEKDTSRWYSPKIFGAFQTAREFGIIRWLCLKYGIPCHLQIWDRSSLHETWPCGEIPQFHPFFEVGTCGATRVDSGAPSSCLASCASAHREVGWFLKIATTKETEKENL